MMAYGKLSTELGEQLALAKGVTLFKVGTKVRTNHGNEGTISAVEIYGEQFDNGEGRLYWNMCDYRVSGDAFGAGGLRVDFVDAHYTLGGTLKQI